MISQIVVSYIFHISILFFNFFAKQNINAIIIMISTYIFLLRLKDISTDGDCQMHFSFDGNFQRHSTSDNKLQSISSSFSNSSSNVSLVQLLYGHFVAAKPSALLERKIDGSFSGLIFQLFLVFPLSIPPHSQSSCPSCVICGTTNYCKPPSKQHYIGFCRGQRVSITNQNIHGAFMINVYSYNNNTYTYTRLMETLISRIVILKKKKLRKLLLIFFTKIRLLIFFFEFYFQLWFKKKMFFIKVLS